MRPWKRPCTKLALLPTWTPCKVFLSNLPVRPTKSTASGIENLKNGIAWMRLRKTKNSTLFPGAFFSKQVKNSPIWSVYDQSTYVIVQRCANQPRTGLRSSCNVHEFARSLLKYRLVGSSSLTPSFPMPSQIPPPRKPLGALSVSRLRPASFEPIRKDATGTKFLGATTSTIVQLVRLYLQLMRRRRHTAVSARRTSS
jgi:hypothetical protein